MHSYPVRPLCVPCVPHCPEGACGGGGGGGSGAQLNCVLDAVHSLPVGSQSASLPA